MEDVSQSNFNFFSLFVFFLSKPTILLADRRRKLAGATLFILLHSKYDDQTFHFNVFMSELVLKLYILFNN